LFIIIQYPFGFVSLQNLFENQVKKRVKINISNLLKLIQKLIGNAQASLYSQTTLLFFQIEKLNEYSFNFTLAEHNGNVVGGKLTLALDTN
jgi:hypothetical protein